MHVGNVLTDEAFVDDGDGDVEGFCFHLFEGVNGNEPVYQVCPLVVLDDWDSKARFNLFFAAFTNVVHLDHALPLL